MCGIFGLVGGTCSDTQAGRAVSAMRARGPDGDGYAHLAPDMLLGHTRLAIVDLDARADQPMFGLGGRLAIVFNGEIYNAADLRRELTGYPWTTDHSDTETILAAYARWGLDAVTHLRGMFAFALWDEAEHRLVLAVDRFSIKPLLIAERDGALAFASSARALAGLGVPLVPHLPAVHSWLADGELETGAETFFSGISNMPAAHFGVWTPGGALALRRYWSPPDAAPRDLSEDEVRARVTEALDSHLMSDVPVGVNLSSGLDSWVLRQLTEEGGQDLHAYTFSFPGTPYDEAARLSAVMPDDARWVRTPVDAHGMWADLPRATAEIELPIGGVGIFGHWRNAQAARAAGCKVLLAGEGADEVFGGYKYYAEAAVADLWRRGETAEAEALWRAFHDADPEGWPRGPEALAHGNAREPRLKAPDGTSLASGHVTPDFARTPRLAEPAPVPGDPVRAAMWRDLTQIKVPKLLRWQDRCYMASGVEIRVPYLDHPLVEAMSRLPVSALFAGGQTKAPLRRLVDRHKNEALLRQPKLYVATPQREWLKRDLKTEVDALLDPGAALARRGLVDLAALRADYARYVEEEALGNSFFVWKFITMELFFQGFFERVETAA